MAKKRSFPGSIFTRKSSNNLYVRYKKIQISLKIPDTPANRKIAEKTLEKLYLVDNGYIDAPTVKKKVSTFSDVWNQFMQEKFPSLSERTKRNYTLAYDRIVTNKHAIFNDKNIRVVLHNLRESGERKKGSGHKKENLSEITAITHNTYLRNFTVFLTWASKEKLLDVDVNTYGNFKRKDVKPKRPKVISNENIQRIFSYWQYRDREFYLLLRFLALTGGRITETLRLKWSDVTDAYVYFPNKVKRYETNIFPITSLLVEVLDELRTMNVDKVFSWSVNSDSRLRRRFRQSCEELEIPFEEGDGFHLFRKTFGTQLFDNKFSLDVIKDLMRHSNIQTTLEHYKEHRAKQNGESLNMIQIEQDKNAVQ